MRGRVIGHVHSPFTGDLTGDATGHPDSFHDVGALQASAQAP
jgi:hypothetical protein